MVASVKNGRATISGASPVAVCDFMAVAVSKLQLYSSSIDPFFLNVTSAAPDSFSLDGLGRMEEKPTETRSDVPIVRLLRTDGRRSRAIL
ncbi:hypothetical protein R1flu_001287 [Riccia fluitans]|uniref:Uncharacterized protein n=1 Tax=Riccia fluitans TaxID=41844 RepID=A0ABD1Y5U6_9MARC